MYLNYYILIISLKHYKITGNKLLWIRAVTLILLPNFRKPHTGIFQIHLYHHYLREPKRNEIILSTKYTFSLHCTLSSKNIIQKLGKTIYIVEVLKILVCPKQQCKQTLEASLLKRWIVGIYSKWKSSTSNSAYIIIRKILHKTQKFSLISITIILKICNSFSSSTV